MFTPYILSSIPNFKIHNIVKQLDDGLFPTKQATNQQSLIELQLLVGNFCCILGQVYTHANQCICPIHVVDGANTSTGSIGKGTASYSTFTRYILSSIRNFKIHNIVKQLDNGLFPKKQATIEQSLIELQLFVGNFCCILAQVYTYANQYICRIHVVDGANTSTGPIGIVIQRSHDTF